jgi:Trk-type K+ transport system membrane component
MNVVILVAGIFGLVVCAFAMIELAVDAVKYRHYVDILLAVAVAVGTVLLLLNFGDSLMR